MVNLKCISQIFQSQSLDIIWPVEEPVKFGEQRACTKVPKPIPKPAVNLLGCRTPGVVGTNKYLVTYASHSKKISETNSRYL